MVSILCPLDFLRWVAEYFLERFDSYDGVRRGVSLVFLEGGGIP